MTTYKKQDIVLVPFPFSELIYTKKRPALILANILTRDELICMMLTSTKKTDSNIDVAIKNLANTGLPKPTVARTSRLFTLKSSIVVKRIGKIEDYEYNKIYNKLIQLLK